MPRYFFSVAEGRKPVWRAANADLSTDDVAREYALGLAETLMQSDADAQDHGPNLVVISTDKGDVIDVVRAGKPEPKGDVR